MTMDVEGNPIVEKKVRTYAFANFVFMSKTQDSREGRSGVCDRKTQQQNSALPSEPHTSLSSIRTGAVTNTPQPTARMQLRTCRQCKKRFSPSENHASACRYHPEAFTGDSRRKAEWGDNNQAENYTSGDGTAEHFWW